MPTPTFRIFLSSPGDVHEERGLACGLIDKLNTEFDGRVRLETFSWEEQYYSAEKSFQGRIPPPSSHDLVVVILWKRLGSDLPSEYNRPDGTPRTGTEYEFEEALYKARKYAAPTILTFRKTGDVTFQANTVEDELAAYRRLEAFWTRWFHDEDGHFIGGFKTFVDSKAFVDLLEKSLRIWLDERLPPSEWSIAKHGSPYPGLRPFDASYLRVFFGRSRALREARARLLAHAAKGENLAFLLITGMSGSGKSSFARAGLLPAIMQPGSVTEVDAWRTVTFRPLDTPSDALLTLAKALFTALPEIRSGDYDAPEALTTLWTNYAEDAARPVVAALRRSGPKITQLLLLVDQLEEIFQLPKVQQELFCMVLKQLCACGQVWGVGTLRSDFYKAFLDIPEGKALRDAGREYPLAPPNPSEIREIIEEPARLAGVEFDVNPQSQESLSKALELAASGSGFLPLLQFTLAQLFAHRDGNLMRWEAYNALGGLEGALSTHARDILEQQEAAVRQALPRVLLELTTLRPESPGAVVSQPADRNLFFQDTEAETLIKALSAPGARLITFDGNVQDGVVSIRVAHEALLTRWDVAEQIIAGARDGLLARARLAHQARIWQAAERLSDLLQTSLPLLEETQSLLSKHSLRLSKLEKDYLAASYAWARGVRLLKRTAIAALIMFACVATGAAWWAQLQRNEATRQRLIADEQLSKANKNLGEAFLYKALDSKQRRELNNAKLYALHSLSFDTSRRTSLKLCEVLLNEEEYPNIWSIDSGDYVESLSRADYGSPTEIVLSSDGRSLVWAEKVTGEVRIWDVATGQLRVWPSDDFYGTRALALSPDGHILASVETSLEGSTVKLWDMTKGQELGVLSGHEKPVMAIALSRDGGILALGTKDSTVQLWDVATGQEFARTGGHESSIISLTFSPDGRTLASGDKQGEVRLLDVDSLSGRAILSELALLKGHFLTFSPDGRSLATSVNNDVQLWDAHSGQKKALLRGHSDALMEVSFSPDGQTLASASRDGTIRLWDAYTGQQRAVLHGHDGRPVFSLAFLHNGKTLASGGDGGEIRLWDIDTGQQRAVFGSPYGAIFNLLSSSDGRTLISQNQGRDIRFWDTGSLLRRLESTKHDKQVQNARFSPDTRTLAVGFGNSTVSLWDVATGQERTAISETIQSYRFSPDSRTLAVTLDSSTALLWDVTTGKRRTAISEKVCSILGFSPDSQLIALKKDDDDLLLWNVSMGQKQMVLSGFKGLNYSVRFSSDSRTIAIQLDNSTFSLFDARSGQERTAINKNLRKVNEIVFLRDNLVAASESESNVLTIWDIYTGKKQAAFNGVKENISTLELSPDGRYLAVGYEGGAVWLWDVANWQGKPMPTEREGLHVFKFSFDGRILAGGYDNGLVTLWDLTKGNITAEMEFTRIEEGLISEPARISSFAFSPDNHVLCIYTESGVRLYDLAVGEEVVNANIVDRYFFDTNADYRIHDFTFSPEGRPLAIVADNSALRLIDYSPVFDDRPVDVRIAEASRLYGLKLEAIDLTDMEPEKMGLPIWPLDHPFHLEPLAQQGDKKAMVDLGIAYERVWQYEKALPWYEKAAALGDEYGAQHLSWLKARLARSSAVQEK